jgi:hypothetical protein
MRWSKRFLLACGLLWGGVSGAFAQDQPVPPASVPTDSVRLSPAVTSRVQTGADTLLMGKKPKHSPRKALLLSMALPGLGQAYNRSYWKIPLIYAGLGTLGYFILDNNNKYQAFSEAYLIKLKDPSTSPAVIGYPNGLQRAESYRQGRDFYRRNYELSLILTAALWALNMVDANVDAHLKGFDLSDDLSLRIRPGAPGVAAAPTLGLSLVLAWK